MSMCSDLEQKCFITLGKGAQGKAESLSAEITKQWVSILLSGKPRKKPGEGWRVMQSAQRCFSIPQICRHSPSHHAEPWKGRMLLLQCFPCPALSAAEWDPSVSSGHDEVHSLVKYLQCRNSDARKSCLSVQIHLLISKIDKQNHKGHATLTDLRLLLLKISEFLCFYKSKSWNATST